jgi:regulatory protein
VSDGAYQTALRLLGRRDYFREELAKRLLNKGFSSAETSATIDRCAALGLLDDLKLATRFVARRAASKGWGPRRLAAELQRRGLCRELAEDAVRLSPELFEDALSEALRRIELRAPQGWWHLHERRARMLSSLIARGFDADDARRALDERAAQREKQHDARHDQQGDPIRFP